jgi:hypothetical protein
MQTNSASSRALTDAERNRLLGECVSTFRRVKKASIEFANALDTMKRTREPCIEGGKVLRTIVKLKLYKGLGLTFETFCPQELGISSSEAYRLIGASVVAEKLSRIREESGGGDLNDLISSLDQYEALGRLKQDPEAMAAIVLKVVEKDGALTASALRTQVGAYLAPIGEAAPEEDDPREHLQQSDYLRPDRMDFQLAIMPAGLARSSDFDRYLIPRQLVRRNGRAVDVVAAELGEKWPGLWDDADEFLAYLRGAYDQRPGRRRAPSPVEPVPPIEYIVHLVECLTDEEQGELRTRLGW